jgi:hypothetical protein
MEETKFLRWSVKGLELPLNLDDAPQGNWPIAFAKWQFGAFQAVPVPPKLFSA